MANTTGFSETKRTLLEKYLSGNLPQPTREAIPQCVPGSPAPLSFGQQQMWLLSQLLPATPVYTECVTIHLPGPLDVAILEKSFNEILRRHEAWRTSFPLVNGQLIQRIHPAKILQLPVIDLRHLPAAEREPEALHRLTNDAQQPFDIANGPLLRPTLIRLGDEDHRLFLTLHHIIFDGFSLYQIFLPELRTLYDAFLSGQPSPLPPLPLQYADFATWQRQRLQADGFANQLAYWKKQLAGAPASLTLPTDHPRPPVQEYHGAMHPFTLSQDLTDGLRALSQREGVTLYMTLVAAFQTLLYRYSGQDDILVGTAISDRKRPELQALMGFFLNTLVLRTNLSGNPTFHELLERVREVVLEAHAHQDVPFEYLVKELQPERNLSQNPLFQALISIEPPLHALPSGWTLTQMDVETETAKFDLTLELDDRPQGFIGRFEYNTDLFDASTIIRMLGHWQTLLESIVVDPKQHLTELPLLTEAERQQVLVKWNNTTVDYRKDLCLHQMFEAQVARTPDAVAMVFENECLTYQELNSKANQLAHRLQGMGVGPEVLVGVCMERSLEIVVALLAILKAGGAYVPLDPAYPQGRVAFMLQDARVPVLLTQQRLAVNLPQHMSRVICLDADWRTIARECDKNLTNRTASENLAYVLYTSGSTGRPKGVVIEHRNAAAFVQWATSVFTSEDLAGVLASTSICFDLSIFELFVPLTCGGTVQLIENLLHLPGISPDRRVTLVNTVPSAMAQLLRNHRLPVSVRTVNLAGEPLSSTLVERLYSQSTVQKVFNLYGPTETTTYSTYTQIEKGACESSIGRPIANTQVYILDSHLQPVPIGVVGELYIGGKGVTRGYLNRPELTAERFILIPDPFNQKPGTRLYKTGDLARYRPNGSIDFLGRSDHQVKVRGFRIELGEIEEVLRQHPAVREAVVVAREDIPGDKHLVAYVAAAQGQTPAIKNLQSSLQEKLPGYMLPSAFVRLDALPLTPNGKVDRHALPVPGPAGRTAEETYVAPKLTVHYQLIQIWEELLDTRPIGIRNNFFYLGGHSLLAARLIDRIEHVFGKKLPLSTLFAGPTIEQLADALQEQEDTGLQSSLVKVQVGGSMRPFFFMHADYKGGPFYCFPLARGLGSDQPFYALGPYRFDTLRVPPTLEAMAATHVKLLRTVQPEGPYLLGGFCSGGLVAYEMARKLHAEGQTVDLLVLIDPTPVGYLRRLRRVINHFGNLMRLSHEKQFYWFLWVQHMYKYLRHLYRYIRLPRYRRLQTELKPEEVSKNGGTILTLEHLYELVLKEGTGRWGSDERVEFGHRRDILAFALPRLDAIFPDAVFPPIEVLCHDWAGLFYWSASDYVPDLYPGTSTFFFFRDSVERGREAKWRRVAEARDEQVEIHILPGTHDTCKTEHLQDLAERLRMCLSQTQAVH